MSICASSSPGVSRSSATTEEQARRRLDYLLSKIASKAPAPASGSAAAAVAATAAALVQKVALLSRKHWPEADDIHRRAEELRHSEELIERDSMAYLAYVEAVRSGADVGAAEAATVDIPLDIVKAAAEVAVLAERSVSQGNPKLRADAVVAGMLASAAADSAAFLVGVNLGETDDARLDEAQRLAREASARLRSPGARGSSGGPGRG